MGHEAQSKENPTAVQTTVAERVYTAAPKTVELNGITYTLGAEKTIDASDYPIFEATDPEGQAVEIAFVPKDQGIVPANRRHIQDQEGQSIYISAPLPSPTERIDGYEDLVRAIGENRAKFAPTIKAIIEHHLRIAIEEANEGRTIVRFKYALAPNLEDPKPLYITLDVQPGEADTKVNTNLVEQNQKTCLAQFFQWYKIDKLKDVLSERQIGHLKALEKADAPATRHNIIRGFLQSTTGPQAAPPPEEVLATENKVAETSVDQVIPTTSSEPPVAPNRLRRLVPWALGTAAAMTTAFALNRGGQEKPVAPTPPGITATTKAQITGVVSQPPKPPSQPSIAPAAGSWLKQRF
ncbi:hypothetical protein KA119_00460 [Candidatus Gracilibacteria bacterium]|nr:hypothetical protein [Candidatus Gracilibacteria bacterium]